MPKRMTQTDFLAVERYMDAFSKRALADIVVDLVRQMSGDEDLDGVDLAAAVLKRAEPVMNVRNDRMPKTTQFFRSTPRDTP
ncbi:MAG: hypothetical protein AAFR76_01365 [Planctomycetota bacterium]